MTQAANLAALGTNVNSSGVLQPAGGGTGASGGFNYDNWAEKNYADITTNPYQFGVDALTDTTGKTASKIVGGAGLMSGNLPVAAVGMGIKAYNKIQNIAEANASLKIMEAQNLQDSTEYKNLKKLTDAAIDDLPGLQKAAVKNGVLATGNEYAEPVIKRLKTGVDTPAATIPVAPVKDKSGVQGQTAPLTSPLPPKNPTRSGTGNTGGNGSGSGNVGSSGTTSPSSYAGYTSAGTSTPAKSTSGGNVGSAGTSSPSSYAGYTSAGTSTPSKPSPAKAPANAGSTRFKEGGLITKPQKTTPKTKGLAGKQ